MKEFGGGHTDGMLETLKDLASNYDLLSAEQEVELAKDIEAGVYADKLLEEQKYQDKYDYYDLQEVSARGKEAKEVFVNSNIRLAFKFANRYYQPHKGLSFEDVVASGLEGLVKAVQHFDYTKGYKFSTYAPFWIRQRIGAQYERVGDMIRLTSEKRQLLGRYVKAKNSLIQSGTKHPNIEEIARKMKVKPKMIKQAEEWITLQNSVSLDETIVGYAEDSLIDILPSESFTDTLIDEVDFNRIRDFIKGLPEDERDIFMSIMTEKPVNIYYRRKLFSKLLHPSNQGLIDLSGYIDDEYLEARENAACRDMDYNDFFSNSRGSKGKASRKLAEAACEQCPLANTCNEFAKEHKLKGVWGISEKDMQVAA